MIESQIWKSLFMVSVQHYSIVLLTVSEQKITHGLCFDFECL